ncbi:outer membrane beta-barrel protein [Saccharophagus degradans]|uniref:outer membrane beta-barrel protein n=1 Tax=Saccharophagus degradans TaxID=86304 RepID=UPI001C09CF23|nr:outer membrane beta-barrel protein [Saccharophagus degradans]MBU2984623.1 outer membrane beta-barrel protein [Saccharophagus degradans]
MKHHLAKSTLATLLLTTFAIPSLASYEDLDFGIHFGFTNLTVDKSFSLSDNENDDREINGFIGAQFNYYVTDSVKLEGAYTYHLSPDFFGITETYATDELSLNIGYSLNAGNKVLTPSIGVAFWKMQSNDGWGPNKEETKTSSTDPVFKLAMRNNDSIVTYYFRAAPFDFGTMLSLGLSIDLW